MEKLNILIEYLLKGDDPTQWLFIKFTIAFIGGVISYFIKEEFFTKPGERKYKFFRAGFLFSFFASFSGVILLSPGNVHGYFVAGLLGVSALTSFISRNNKGASSFSSENKELKPKEIEERYKK